MSVLSVVDENGNEIPIPSIKGKSAYDYAKDGGYTGTEAEFAQKMAEEKRTVILTGNLPSATGFSTTIKYPDGFNQGNCYLSSFEVYFNNSWRCGTGLDADTTLRLFATLETSGVRAYTSGSPVYNAPFRVGLTKL